MHKLIKTLLIIIAPALLLSHPAISRIVESTGDGDWTQNSTWSSNQVPIDGDTIIILAGHTVSLSSTINNNHYYFMVIRGTLDLTSGGKLKIGDTSILIIEEGGKILGNNNADQIDIGTGPPEYSGTSGEISGPTFVSDGTPPTSGGGLPPGYIPLPVELLTFTANPNENSIILRWSTASELNNDYFTLEKSHNGRDFDLLGKVVGNGTKSTQTDYAYTDNNPYLGLSYYRLSQTDFDGTSEIFPAISVLFTPTSNLRVYPNPIRNNALRIQSTGYQENEAVNLNLYNIYGQMIISKKLNADSYGNLETSILFADHWKEGHYILELTSSKRKDHFKVHRE
jgi:hypothetical protein